MARTEGFDCWKPWAPGIGENLSGMAKRVEGSWPHHPANLVQKRKMISDVGEREQK